VIGEIEPAKQFSFPAKIISGPRDPKKSLTGKQNQKHLLHFGFGIQKRSY